MVVSVEADAGLVEGLETGDINGEVCKFSGTWAEVSKTKKASPPSPSFIAWSCRTLLTQNSTLTTDQRPRFADDIEIWRHLLLIGSQQRKLSEPDMKGRAGQRAYTQ